MFANIKSNSEFIVLLFQLFSRFTVFQIKGYGGGSRGGGYQEHSANLHKEDPWDLLGCPEDSRNT